MRLATYSYPGAGAFMPGFGDVVVNPNAVTAGINMGANVANQTGSAVAGAVAGGASLAASIFALTPALAAACPPCGAALAIGAALVGIIAKMTAGCGNSCIAASDAANQAEPLLVQNVTNYVTAPVRYKSLQLAALANFDQIFTALEQKCQQIGGQGGTNCIKDRVAGACHWKATPGAWAKDSNGTYQWTPAGAAGSGTSCWNWVVGYRDPIANDPGVIPDPQAQSAPGSIVNSISDSISSLFSSGSATPGPTGIGGISPMMLLLGGVALYLVMD